MKGLTRIIVQDLEQGLSVNQIVLKNPSVNPSAIYKIAKRNNIPVSSPERLSDEEKKAHKKQADAAHHAKKIQIKRDAEFDFERPDIPMPELPMTAMKCRGLGAFNSSWIFREGNRLSPINKTIVISHYMENNN